MSTRPPDPDLDRKATAAVHRARIEQVLAGTMFGPRVLAELDEILALLADAERETDRMTDLMLDDEEWRRP